jgi:uncharacterized integral membrane protein
MHTLMQIFLFGALAVSLIAILFALQNVVPVTVTFFGWTFQESLALVLFVAFVGGALASFLASLPAVARGRRASGHQRRTTAELEASLAECERKLQDAQMWRREPGSAPPQGQPPSATP